MGLKIKKVVEKINMGLGAQKSFAQMYEDRNMNKRVRGEMMKLYLVIVQETRKEIRARKTQPLLKIGKKSNNLARIFIWTVVAQRRTPLDYRFRQHKTLPNKGFQVRF